MLKLTIPGRGTFTINNLVLDLNGTLTVDGHLAGDTISLLNRVSETMQIFILTADTLGSAARLQQEIKGNIRVLDGEGVGAAKGDFLTHLGANSSIAVGNGENDVQMLQKAIIGIAVLGPEGCSVRALHSADLLVKDINDALMLILKPQRLVAGLRD